MDDELVNTPEDRPQIFGAFFFFFVGAKRTDRKDPGVLIYEEHLDKTSKYFL